MKDYTKRLGFILALVAFFLLSFFYFAQSNKAKLVFPNQVGKTSPVLSMRLVIPTIGVNAAIQKVGVTQKGEMEVPRNAGEVGWFEFGARPGEKGSAVIAGHFDGENGEAGVFFNLYKLKKGDKLFVEDSGGVSVAFVVLESRLYNPGYADDVFSRNDGFFLNIITCDGVWDGTKKSFSKRLVVFTEKLSLDM